MGFRAHVANQTYSVVFEQRADTPAVMLQQATRTGGDHQRPLQDLQLERRRRRVLSVLCVCRRHRQAARPAGPADPRAV
jgi:hypothetical protein